MGRQLYRDNHYTDRLLKLIPVEFISLYLAITQAVSDDLDLRQPVLLIVIVLFTILIPVYLYKIQSVKSHKQIVLTVFSFLVWTYSLGDAYMAGAWIRDFHNTTIASVLLLLWTGMSPVFVTNKQESVNGATKNA